MTFPEARPRPAPTRRRLVKFSIVIAALAMLFAACTPEIVHTQNLINGTRGAYGRAGLDINLELFFKAQSWADKMAAEQRLSHSYLPAGNSQPWRKLGENVGVGGDLNSIHNSFMTSSGHRNNILDPAFNQLGVGVTRDGAGRYWVVHEFMQL